MRPLAPLALATAVLAIAGGALAATSKSTYSYRATISPGAEVPKPKGAASAKGVFTATVTESGTTRSIRWTLTFSGLSGKAGAAHIHAGKAGVAGGVLLGLCGPCKNGQTGVAKISKNAADVLERGGAYVNVHTSRNPGGEIRGQLKLVGHTGSASSDPQTSPTPTPPPSGGYGGGTDGY